MVGIHLVLLAMMAASASPQNSVMPTTPASPSKSVPSDDQAKASFVAMDKDSNGTIERAEWTAAGHRDQGFDLFDTDGNGKLTLDEIKAGLIQLRARKGS